MREPHLQACYKLLPTAVPRDEASYPDGAWGGCSRSPGRGGHLGREF